MATLAMTTPVRLTPIDITSKRFRRALRGYRPSEVDEFLAEIGADYEAVTVENAHLREQVAQMQQELERYRAIEEALKEALVLAQRTADELRANAHRDAEVIRAQAELQARQQMEQQMKALEELRAHRQQFAIELRASLNAMLEFVERHLSAPASGSAIGGAVQAEQPEQEFTHAEPAT